VLPTPLAPPAADEPGYEPQVVVRAPATRRVRVRDFFSYGPLIRVLATRDLRVRYKQSALGPIWVVVQPLALLGAFAVGFNGVAHVNTGGVPYAVFVLAGLGVWSYLQASLMVAVNSIVTNFTLVRWTACPRLALPLASLLASIPALAVPVVAAVLTAAITGHLAVQVVLLPFAILWLILFVTSIGFIIATISVRARDIVSAMPFLLQILLFVSPVAYPSSALGGTLGTLISLNPLTGIIDVWRWVILGSSVDALPLTVSVVATVVLAVGAWQIFGRMEPAMADHV
jgi:lipopolysaccharide transport system permease protein